MRVLRALHLAYLRWCLRCLNDERTAYLAANFPLGPQYLRNSAAMARDLRSRIAALECGIKPFNVNRRT